MDIRSLSQPGGRPVNEDRVVHRCSGKAFFAAVADGLGGHGSGDLAAEAVLKHLEESFPGEGASKEMLQRLIAESNELVLSSCSGKSTLAMIWGQGDAVFSVHVGDSRIYQFRNQEILFQSRDHSVSQLAVAVGEITQAEVRGHVDRNKLIRSLGSRDGGLPEIHPLELQPGDGILLCSDGFWELILEDEMINMYKNAATAQAWLDAMARLVSQRTGDHGDNYSAAVLLYERRNT